MKKLNKLQGIFSLVLVFGFLFTGCPTSSGSSDPEPAPTPAPAPAATTGTLTIYNNAKTETDLIVRTVIMLAGESIPAITDTTPIKFGESKSFTLEAGGYSITVTDNWDFPWTALASIGVNKTTNLSYNGSSLQ